MARLTVTLCLVLVLSSQGQASSIYEPLFKYIREQSNRNLLSRTDPSKPLTVDFQVSLVDIIDVDYDKNQIKALYATNCAFFSGITWDPAQFNGIGDVAMPITDLFVPVISIFNDAEKHVSWYNDRIFLNHRGFAVHRTMNNGKIFCNDLESNTCTIRAGSVSTFNDAISFLEPAKRHFDFREVHDEFYFSGSNYEVTSQLSEIHIVPIPLFPGKNQEFIDYVFSFKEKHHNGPHRALFQLG